MHKVVNETKVSFFDNSDNEIMYIDYPTDECIWYFNNSEVITITKDMELFELLKALMSQQYEIDKNVILHTALNKKVFRFPGVFAGFQIFLNQFNCFLK